MRVLILTADYEPHCWSGIGSAVAAQARALAARGVDVHVATPAAAIPDRGARDRPPVVHRLRATGFPADPASFDWVHLHSLGLAELAVELCRRYRKPLVYTAHSVMANELDDSPRARFWASVQQQIFSVCDRLVLPTEAERERVPARAAGAVVIPNGVWPLRDPEPGPRGSEGPIVFAGRLTRSKGIGILADVIAGVRQRAPASFVIAGGHGDPDGARTVAGILAVHGDICHATGWLRRERLDELFAVASLVLVPSMYEPFGLVALEAMRSGAPVLAAAVGGLREIIRPGSGGELATSHRPDEWVSRILALLEDSTRRRKMSVEGPAYVAAHFDPGRLAARLVREVYA